MQECNNIGVDVETSLLEPITTILDYDYKQNDWAFFLEKRNSALYRTGIYTYKDRSYDFRLYSESFVVK